MTDEEYAAWAKYHADMFCINNDEGFRSLKAWRIPFESKKYTAAELTESTNRIALRGAPRFLSEHLAELHEEIRDMRQRKQWDEEAAERRRHAEEFERQRNTPEYIKSQELLRDARGRLANAGRMPDEC